MSFWRYLAKDKSNWGFVGVMLVIIAFAINSHYKGDDASAQIAFIGVGILAVIVLILSIFAYRTYKKTQSDDKN